MFSFLGGLLVAKQMLVWRVFGRLGVTAEGGRGRFLRLVSSAGSGEEAWRSRGVGLLLRGSVSGGPTVGGGLGESGLWRGRLAKVSSSVVCAGSRRRLLTDLGGSVGASGLGLGWWVFGRLGASVGGSRGRFLLLVAVGAGEGGCRCRGFGPVG